MRSICIFGDSIMKGVMFDSAQKKYVLLPNSDLNGLAEKWGVNIDNESRFGCTINRGFERIERIIEKKRCYDGAILEFGGNDCDYNWKAISEAPDFDHRPKTEPGMFKEIYTKIIVKLKAAGIMPVVMTLPPVDAEKYLGWLERSGLSRQNLLKWLGDVQTIYRFQELYSNIAAGVANEHGAILLDVRSAFLWRHDFYRLICDDGLHPNEDGRRVLIDALAALKN